MFTNNIMQKIISQIPELSTFLSRVPKADHYSTIKQIIKLGLQSMHSYNSHNQNHNPNHLAEQIDRIKQNIEELNQMVKYKCHHCCNFPNSHYQKSIPKQNSPQRDYNRQIREQNNGNNFSFKGKNRDQFQPPVRGTSKNYVQNQFIENKSTINPFSKNKNIACKHHLDDTQSKQALTFPPSLLADTAVRPLRRKSQEYKKHIYQDQINKEEQVKLKQEIVENDQVQRTRAVTDYRTAKSKIKNLLDKDRIRFIQKQRQQQFKQGYTKYEYSDQNQMQESSIPQQPQKDSNPNNKLNYQQNTSNLHFHSSFKGSNPASSSQKASSSKKQFVKSKNQVSSKLQVSNQNQPQSMRNYSKSSSESSKNEASSRGKYNMVEQQQQEEEDDVVSNSSSFSQFSISNSQKRNIGKISRRSNK